MNEENDVGYCPKCGKPLSAPSHFEGGWCESCQEWFPDDIVQEWMMENE